MLPTDKRKTFRETHVCYMLLFNKISWNFISVGPVDFRNRLYVYRLQYCTVLNIDPSFVTAMATSRHDIATNCVLKKPAVSCFKQGSFFTAMQYLLKLPTKGKHSSEYCRLRVHFYFYFWYVIWNFYIFILCDFDGNSLSFKKYIVCVMSGQILLAKLDDFE